MLKQHKSFSQAKLRLNFSASLFLCAASSGCAAGLTPTQVPIGLTILIFLIHLEFTIQQKSIVYRAQIEHDVNKVNCNDIRSRLAEIKNWILKKRPTVDWL